MNSTVYAILTYSATVFSVLMNASPVITIRRLEQAGTIGSSTITFFGAQMYNCVTWGSYGVFTSSIPLLISGVLGNSVSTYCSLVFLTVARREERSGRKLQSTTYAVSVMTSLFFLALCWSHLALCVMLIASGRRNLAFTITGWEGSVAAVVMLSSPLMMFQYIIKAKNAECLAPLTVTFGFLNTFLWTIAGFMSGDMFLIVPNILCCAACVAQYVLLFMYGRKPTKAPEIREAIAAVPFD